MRYPGVPYFNWSTPEQNDHQLAHDISRCIFVNEKFCIMIKISLTFVPTSPINNNPASVWIMAWRRIGDKPLSEPMLAWFNDAYARHWGEELSEVMLTMVQLLHTYSWYVNYPILTHYYVWFSYRYIKFSRSLNNVWVGVGGFSQVLVTFNNVDGSFNIFLTLCLNNPIFSNLGLCAACWVRFMCHHELWPTSVSHPFSSLNSSLGYAGGKHYQKITIPMFRLVLQNFSIPGYFPFILFYRYLFLAFFSLVCCCSVWLYFSQWSS